MTVDRQVPPATARPSPIRRILYATDLTPSAAKAAAFAGSFAQVTAAKIELPKVIEAGAVDHPDKWGETAKSPRCCRARGGERVLRFKNVYRGRQ
jgi:hypothetical protein